MGLKQKIYRSLSAICILILIFCAPIFGQTENVEDIDADSKLSNSAPNIEVEALAVTIDSKLSEIVTKSVESRDAVVSTKNIVVLPKAVIGKLKKQKEVVPTFSELATPNIQKELIPTTAELVTPSMSMEEIPTAAVIDDESGLIKGFIVTTNATDIDLKVETKDQKAEKKEIIFEYLDIPEPESFYFPPKPRSKYPDLAIDGFYEGKYSGRNFDPKNVTWDVWETIRRDPVYSKIPRDVLVGDPKFDMRYNISIEGKLDEDLSVHYDIEQEPDFPGKYDIQVKHKRTTLTFHHFDAEFQNGDFINVKKALNGVKLEAYDDDWSAIVTTGKQRSEPKKFEAPGNGTNKISVGRGSLLEDSVKVYVNNSLVKEGVDYEVNYFEGAVTFSTVKTKTDYIEVIYEFTNPIEDFIPVLSRKNFVGAQYLWRSKPQQKDRKLTGKKSETIAYFSPSVNVGVTTNEVIDEEVNEDLNKVFFLKYYPIVLGSETVMINDRYLKKNIDYSLKHNNGRLKLLDFSLTEFDKLKVDYESYVSSTKTEDLIAKDSNGPYFLSEKNIIPGTVTINVDDELVNENEDYFMDYEKGSMKFNYKLDYPKIISAEYGYIKSQTVSTADVKESPFSFGVTYLNEYVKSQEEDLIGKVTSENLTTTLNIVQGATETLMTQFNPLEATEDIVVYINGSVATASVDYEIGNAYKGEINILNADAKRVDVSYTYKKSFRTSYMFQGIDGIERYENGLHFQLREIPMKYNGLEYIRMRHEGEELKLSEGYEYTIDYGEDGGAGREKNIIITFIKQDAGNASMLDFYPGRRDMITLIYDYTPAESPDQGNIDQKMVGITLGSKINENWSFQAEVAAADNNFSKPQVAETKVFSGSGIDNASYPLRPNLVEDSEYIFIKQANGRTQLLTKDKDYFLHYTTGTLRFINLTPGPEDEIEVQYEYFDTSGIVQAGENQGFKLASKFSTEYKSDDFDFKTYYKKVDKEFLPLAPIQDTKGTQSLGGEMTLRLSNYEHIKMIYERKDEIKQEKKDGSGDSYLHTDNFRSSAKLSMFNIFDTQQELRYTLTAQDPIEQGGAHLNDVRTIEYNGSASFGPHFFRNTILRGYTKQMSDYVDVEAPIITQSETTQLNTVLKGTRLPLLGNVLLNPSYQTSARNTDRTIPSNTEGVSAQEDHSHSIVTTKRMVTKVNPFGALSTSFDYAETETRTQAANSTENVNQVKNQNYNIGYNPFLWLRTAYSHSRRESESPLANQSGRLEINNAFSVKKFMPAGLLVWAGLDNGNLLVAPFHNSFFTYRVADSLTQEHNDKKSFNNNTQRISYNNFSPLPGITLQKIGFEDRKASNKNLIETSISSKNISDSFYTRISSQVNVTPKLPLLNLFSYTLSLDDQQDKRVTTYESGSSTSNSTTRLNPSYTRGQSVAFTPGPIRVGIPGIFLLKLGTFSASMKEDILNNVNSEIKEYYPSTNRDLVLHDLTEERKDELFKESRNYSSSISPFNLFKMTGTYGTVYETRRYNLSANPFRITESNNLGLKGDYSPFRFIKFDGSYSKGRLSQYQSPSLNAQVDDLRQENLQTLPDATVLSNYLGRTDSNRTLGITFTPFSFVSLTGGAKWNSLSEQNTNITTSNTETKMSTSSSNFTQKAGSAGVVLRPLAGLDLSYTYSLIYTNKDDGAINKGYSGVTKLNYTPLQTKTFKVSFSYTRDDNWGSNLNTLDQQSSEQGAEGVIETRIEERKDTVETGSMTINIVIPLTNSPFIDRFEIVGEGYLKKVANGMDFLKADGRRTSYEISGLSLKGTLYF
jgi:hypothetical protein